MLNFERISSVAFCSWVMRPWAVACSISASACFNSDCFSCIVRCRVEASKTTTTSPALIIEPLAASLTIWRSPDCIGAESTIDLSGRMSPRISIASTNCPRVTSLVGRSGAALVRTRTKAAVTPSAMNRHTTMALVGRVRRMAARRAGAVIASPATRRRYCARRPHLRSARR